MAFSQVGKDQCKKELRKAQFLACSSTVLDSPRSCSGAAPVWLCHRTAFVYEIWEDFTTATTCLLKDHQNL